METRRELRVDSFQWDAGRQRDHAHVWCDTITVGQSKGVPYENPLPSVMAGTVYCAEEGQGRHVYSGRERDGKPIEGDTAAYACMEPVIERIVSAYCREFKLSKNVEKELMLSMSI